MARPVPEQGGVSRCGEAVHPFDYVNAGMEGYWCREISRSRFYRAVALKGGCGGEIAASGGGDFGFVEWYDVGIIFVYDGGTGPGDRGSEQSGRSPLVLVKDKPMITAPGH